MARSFSSEELQNELPHSTKYIATWMHVIGIIECEIVKLPVQLAMNKWQLLLS